LDHHSGGDRYQARLAVGLSIDGDQAIKTDAHAAEVASRSLVVVGRAKRGLADGPQGRRDTLAGSSQDLLALELEPNFWMG
jgi:hypothetical protein